jgi:hypothetical protein
VALRVKFWPLAFFYSVLLPKSPYTQQQPAGLALVAVLVLACLGDCRLVVEISASIENFRYQHVRTTCDFSLDPPLFIGSTSADMNKMDLSGCWFSADISMRLLSSACGH